MKKVLLSVCIVCLHASVVSAQSWDLTGNSGTNPAINFVGTTDSQPLVFKAKNKKAGLIDFNSAKANTVFGYQAANSTTGASNSAFGYEALFANIAGYSNVAIGRAALRNNQYGHNLVAIGDSALYNQQNDNFQQYGNTAVGSKTLFSNAYGFNNTALGYRALYSNDGSSNTAVGSLALLNNTSGSSNTATGSNSLYYNTSGIGNTANGTYALHNNTIGYSNVAIGSSALAANVSGNYNVATGIFALSSNIVGNNNIAIGPYALNENSSGYSNVAVGTNTLFNNTAGHNLVAVGDSALYNYTGSSGYNTAIGSKTLYNNTGTNNTATGYQALYNNTTGFYNTASGYYSLRSNTTGVFNTAIGTTSLYSNTGSYNTAVGSSSDVNPGLTNATAIGFGALATASNQVWLGNTSVTSVKAGNNIVIVSDGRFKKNLKENVPGLDFINQLKPVTYNYDIHKLNDYMRPAKNNAADEMQPDVNDKAADEAITKKEKIIYTGFVAQEVEKTAEKLGYDFSGVYKPQNDKDPYGLSYSDFVVPLVKAVQELSKKNDEKDALIEQLITRIDKLEQSSKSSLNTSATGGEMQQLINSNTAQLEQNAPNPFSSSTTIRYRIPSTASTAQVTVANASGITVKTFTLNGKGAGTVSINAGELSAGSYFYSLFVDGKKADSRQMILVK